MLATPFLAQTACHRPVKDMFYKQGKMKTGEEEEVSIKNIASCQGSKASCGEMDIKAHWLGTEIHGLPMLATAPSHQPPLQDTFNRRALLLARTRYKASSGKTII